MTYNIIENMVIDQDTFIADLEDKAEVLEEQLRRTQKQMHAEARAHRVRYMCERARRRGVDLCRHNVWIRVVAFIRPAHLRVPAWVCRGLGQYVDAVANGHA